MYSESDITGPKGDCCRGPKGPDAFDDFQYKANQLIESLGLTDWDISYAHEKLREGVETETRINYGNRCAKLVLSTDVDGSKTAMRGAVHAVCVVLFADLDWVMDHADIISTKKDSLQNAIIRRLENVL